MSILWKTLIHSSRHSSTALKWYPVRTFTARHGKNPAWFWPESLFRGENGTGQSETRNLSHFVTRTRHLSCYCPSGNLARFERDRARLNLSLLKSYVKLNETFVGLYHERECSQNQRDKDKKKFVDYIWSECFPYKNVWLDKALFKPNSSLN